MCGLAQGMLKLADGVIAYRLMLWCASTAVQSVDAQAGAGYNSSLFTLSMPRNFRGGRQVDFARVEGVTGVFIANQLDRHALQRGHAQSEAHYDKFIRSKVLHAVCFSILCEGLDEGVS